MDRVNLLRKAAGWINYMGSKDDFVNNLKSAVKGGSEEDINNFMNKVDNQDNLPAEFRNFVDEYREDRKKDRKRDRRRRAGTAMLLGSLPLFWLATRHH